MLRETIIAKSNSLLSRFKNYGFCVSFFALIPLLCQMAGVKLAVGEWDLLVNALLTFLVAAGLINDPTTENKWYGDDHKA